jgi:hypothetical protein
MPNASGRKSESISADGIMLFPFETLRVHKRRRVNFVVNMAHPVTEAFLSAIQNAFSIAKRITLPLLEDDFNTHVY